MTSDPLLAAWAITATAAAIYYARGEAKAVRQRLWTIKMMLKVYQRAAQVTRDGNKMTFHYEDDKESNTICIEAK